MQTRRKKEGDEQMRTFASIKSGNLPIPVRHPLQRDALVLASLDPAVRSIEYLATAYTLSGATDVEVVVVDRDEGRLYLDVVEARDLRTITRELLVADAFREMDIRAWTLTEAEIHAEPRWSNAIAVWAYHGHPVHIGLRLQILGALREDGAITLGELLGRVRSDRDPTTAVMALACQDLLVLDLTATSIGPATHVRPRG
ncbi:hypothetical protein [Bradyrhizobium embrapense]